MERRCDFCGVPRPVIYCQSDAAFLCLSCDAKVHSANALSGRHYRDLLCDSCRDNTAFVRCIDHSMLLCRGCESRLHDVFSDHKKLMVKSFTGCPSAQHFASLWGFNVSEQVQFSAAGGQVGSESCLSSDRNNWGPKISGPEKPERGRSSKRHKEQNNHQKKQSNGLVLQQILNLKKLQVTEIEKQSFDTFSSSGNADGGLNSPLKEHSSFSRSLQRVDDPSDALENEDFPLPISQLDHLSSSSLEGDLGSSQFWSQNLQDLGVCEDMGHFDDLNIPDVDLSFRNFDELFANEVEFQDVSAASSISFNNDNNVARGTFENTEAVSQSFLSAESSGSDCLDSGHSENFTETEFGNSTTKIPKERRKSHSHGKRSQMGGSNVDSKTRQKIEGRFVNEQGYESGSVDVTQELMKSP